MADKSQVQSKCSTVSESSRLLKCFWSQVPSRIVFKSHSMNVLGLVVYVLNVFHAGLVKELEHFAQLLLSLL